MNRIIYFLSIMALLSSCHQENKSIFSISNITFKVDSVKIYDAEDISKNIFMFSPLGHENKIWTINTTNPHELDLVTGEWTSLTTRFGNVFKRQVREDGIWRDEYTGEVYISCFHDGLIRYFPKKDTFDFLKIHPVTSLYPKKKNIVIGTANGLYFLNRKDNTLSIAENFPLDTWVRSIEELNNDTLLLNSMYYYHTATNEFGAKIMGKSTHKRSTNHNYIPRDIRNKLPNLSGGYREFRSDSISWYYRDSELFYSINKNDFYNFPLFPEGHVRHILEDKEYLFVLFNEIFVIYNKEYILTNSLIHEGAKYEELRNDLLQKSDRLNESQLEFDEYLARSIALYKNDKYSGYSDLQNILKNIPKGFEYYNYEQGVDNLNSILKSKTIPEAFKYSILKGLCRKHTTSAELDSALIYFNLIKELHPTYKDECIDHSYPCIVKASNYLDSLENENISIDKFVFSEAKARENIINCSCWFGDSYINYSIVEEKYQEILTNYPSSEYADDAEYWMINYQNYGEEQGGYHLSQIPSIRKFISKYPNSNLIPELLMNLAYSYSIQNSVNVDDRIENMDRGIIELAKLKNNYQLDSNQLGRVEQNLKQFEHQKNELIYTLTIIPLKSDYRMNEDIEVDIIISNNSSIPRTLELFAKESCFSFGIHPDVKVKFIPIDNDDATKKEFNILKGEPLKQKVKINSLVRHWDGGKLGGFNFEEEGLYYLTCFSRKNSLSSKQVKIYVRK